MRCKLVLFLGFFLLIGLVSAGFNVSDSNIKSVYQASEDVSGWVEISFENQSLNSTFEDNFGNSISLSDLLDVNPSYVSVLGSDNLSVSSSLQKIYFDNASFSLPSVEDDSLIYNLTLDSELVLSQNISITNSASFIPTELSRKKALLENITDEIDAFPLFLRTQIKSAIGLQSIKDNLTNIEITYNSSSGDDFDLISDELEKVKVPGAVFESESASSVSFISNEDVIDLDILETIGGGTYDPSFESEYKNAILFWEQENLDPKITFKKIGVSYDTDSENVLTYIEIVAEAIPSYEVYLVIEDLDGLVFGKNYGESEESGYIYIDVSEIGEKIFFTTSEDLNIDNLPIFISPSLDRISLGGLDENIIDSEAEKKVSKWVLFSLIILFLIIIFVVVYFILHSWYDRKYEDYLFKDKNSLYNLVVYINNSKKKGVLKDKIESSLRKAKWSSEQIRYVMRKYAGKRTGLWAPGILKSSKQNKGLKHTKFNKPKR